MARLLSRSWVAGLLLGTSLESEAQPAAAPLGPQAVATGEQAIATGEYARATGANAMATNYYTQATGWWSTASGGYAVASGFATAASADYAVASGYAAIASSGFAWAPGYFSAANGWYSTAEGDYTFASGHYSRASGYAGVAGTPGHFATIKGAAVTPYRTINDGPAEVDLRAYYSAGDRVQLAPAANVFDFVPTQDLKGRSQLPEVFLVQAVSATALTLDREPGPAWPRAYVSNLSRGMHQEARGAGTFDGNDRAGDGQVSRYVLRGFTTGTAPCRLTANGLEEAGDNRIRLKWGQAISAEVHVVAESEAGASAAFSRRVLIKCSSTGVTRIVGAVQQPVPDLADPDAVAWQVRIEADDDHDALVVSVTGDEARPVRWMARIDAVEVAWFPKR